MAGRGRGNGNAALNQAIIGMNATMQAMQEMMQQQNQMFQQLLNQNAQQGAAQQGPAAAAGGGNQNPPPAHVTLEEVQQEKWMKTMERYKKLAPKSFKKGDATTAFNWLTDVERICNTIDRKSVV